MNAQIPITFSEKQSMLETTPEVNGNREAATLNELLHKDGKKIIVRVAHNGHRLIILFDDIEFERNDYEVLSPETEKATDKQT